MYSKVRFSSYVYTHHLNEYLYRKIYLYILIIIFMYFQLGISNLMPITVKMLKHQKLYSSNNFRYIFLVWCLKIFFFIMNSFHNSNTSMRYVKVLRAKFVSWLVFKVLTVILLRQILKYKG